MKDVPYEHVYNFRELFGGPNNGMEGTENWVEPGESFQYTHRYTMVKGGGKVDFANAAAAAHVELAGDKPRLEVVTLSPVKKLGDTNSYTSIRAAMDMNDLSSAERYQNDPFVVTALEKSGETNTARAGRILYRVGRLQEAEKCLKEVVKADPGDGEAWYFLGLVRHAPVAHRLHHRERGTRRLRPVLVRGVALCRFAQLLKNEFLARRRAGSFVAHLGTMVQSGQTCLADGAAREVIRAIIRSGAFTALACARRVAGCPLILSRYTQPDADRK